LKKEKGYKKGGQEKIPTPGDRVRRVFTNNNVWKREGL